jgi:hypothetical protein
MEENGKFQCKVLKRKNNFHRLNLLLLIRYSTFWLSLGPQNCKFGSALRHSRDAKKMQSVRPIQLVTPSVGKASEDSSLWSLFSVLKSAIKFWGLYHWASSTWYDFNSVLAIRFGVQLPAGASDFSILNRFHTRFVSCDFPKWLRGLLSGTAMVVWGFRGFYQSLQANSGTIPRIKPGQLPSSFQFIAYIRVYKILGSCGQNSVLVATI